METINQKDLSYWQPAPNTNNKEIIYKMPKVKSPNRAYLIIIWLIISTFSIANSCKAQSKYFVAKDVIDKTEQLIKSNAKWTHLKNNEKIDGYSRVGDSIFGGEISCNISPLKNVDSKTFEIYPGSKYGRDKNYVYYPLVTSCVDYDDCGVCYYSKIIVENANSSTFDYLGNDYATDGKNVFFRGELISGADGSSFNVIVGSEFAYLAKDKNHVFRLGKIFENADASTFYIIKDERSATKNSEDKITVGDKDSKWEIVPPDQITKIESK